MENKELEGTDKKICLCWKDIITWYIAPLGSIFVAVAIGISGLLGSSYLKERRAVKARTEKSYLTLEALRIYSGLISKREEVDSALRKDMFNSIISSFSASEKVPIEELILNFRLLAYNYNESLNIKPFFLFMRNKTLNSSMSGEEYLEHLEDVARWVLVRQMWILEEDGECFHRIVDFDLLLQNLACISLKDETLTLEGIERDFKIAVLEVNSKMKEIKVRLEIRTSRKSDHDPDIKVAEFWVGFFDFPMIDNIRLSHGQKCAVVLNQFTETSADITLVIFPDALSGMKGIPYYHEAVQNILETGELKGEKDLKKSWSLE